MVSRVELTTLGKTGYRSMEQCCGLGTYTDLSASMSDCVTASEWEDFRVTERRVRPARPQWSPTALEKAARGYEKLQQQIVVSNNRQTGCSPASLFPSYWNGYHIRSTWEYWKRPSIPALTLDFDEDPCRAKLLARIDDMGLNISDVLAEADEAVEMVYSGAVKTKELFDRAREFTRNPPNVVRKNYYARKRIGKRALGQALVDVNNAHLLGTFGWGPFLSDAADIVDYLRSETWKTRPLVSRIQTSASVTKRMSGVDGYTPWNCRKTMKRSYTIYVQWRNPATGYDLNPGNAVEWLWERIPMSFMVDYFFTIGSYLKTLDAMLRVERWAGTVTTREIETRVGLPYTTPTLNKPASKSSCHPTENHASLYYPITSSVGLSTYQFQEESHQRDVLPPDWFDISTRRIRLQPKASWRKLSIAMSVLAALKQSPLRNLVVRLTP
jgi:hypothetical protein